MVTVAIRVATCDVVLVRALLEAHEGLGLMFAERGGDLLLATTKYLARDLDAFVDDLSETVAVERVTR